MSERWRLKTGDLVEVMSGKYKKYQGKILAVDRQNRKVKVEGVALCLRYRKASGMNGGSSQWQESFFHASKVMLIDPETKRPTRVGMRFEGENKIRYAKKSGREV